MSVDLTHVLAVDLAHADWRLECREGSIAETF